jgi:hypothetical protein
MHRRTNPCAVPVPRNCGDKNDTAVCGHTFTCPFCCNPWYTAACDSCTDAKCTPVPPLPPPVTTKHSCVTMPHCHCIEVSSGYFPSAKTCERACEQPPGLSLSPLPVGPAVVVGLEEGTAFRRLLDSIRSWLGFIQRGNWQ